MKNLKKLRGIYGYSQKELAEKIGVSRQLYCTLENGKINSNSNIYKICEIFNITPCELLLIDNLKFRPNDKQDFQNFINELQKECDKWD